MSKFKVGDKVRLPKTKSVFSRREDSGQLRKAVFNKLDCLYIVKLVCSGNIDYPYGHIKGNPLVYILSVNSKSNSGDYFLEEDLEHYVLTDTEVLKTVSKELQYL